MTRPKASPDSDRRTDTHDRVRRDKDDKAEKAGSVTLRVAGQLQHIGVGRTYGRTDVTLLVQDLHVTVVDTASGEILRDLIIHARTISPPAGHQAPPRNRRTRQDLNLRPTA
jgi:hypothetical protein